MRSLLLAITAGIALSAADSVTARVAQEASAGAAGTRNAVVGKVTNAAGEPVAGALVTLVERTMTHGVPRFHPADVRLFARTDERGEYRIDQARLGEFHVVAIPQNPPSTDDRRMNRVNRSGFAITYHPSVRSAAGAMAVKINVREEQRADIKLVSAALSVVSGTVITSSGTPSNGGRLLIAHGDNLFGIDGKAVQLRPDGSFVLAGVPPGTYFLHFRESAWPPQRGETPLVSGAKVVVDRHDLAGVRVVPIHMVRATGRVIVDPATRSSLLPSGISVAGNPMNWDGNPGPQRSGRVKDDLTFEFATWPGPGYVRLLFDAPGWKVKAIRYKGVDVTDAGIDFKEGQEVSGIEVELAKAEGRGEA